ncbi:hypothetical protein [Pectobacterium carotovorum]|uniref:Uncharacterized protein n=1 Tax=Pectobacterium carotovorum subsp. carotovorum TaxID=555 RepID=A0AAI9PCM8_PECCC|nr:hypothetical protein [Pectobacterium carotovorum]KHT26702.1 hypothetical protein RC98_13425 [Pectobacterium carotovorum subsp. carotovorum]GKV90431.1 hypothetical protein PEC301619_24130 [Pectobacterium carotovorum subsp. carotovorum]GKX46660.1 hypothetical protein SOASR016_14120 [Pectobacterium carotovorum subsp. carotovorum]GLV68569.1 hypothetical protein Pcaca03_10130 [Pectobacterium carotovorum subsp. carotovorum]
MTTESSVTDTVLPPLSEAQGDDPFAEEVNAHYAKTKTSSADVAARRMGLFNREESTDKENQSSRLSWLFKSLLAVLFFVPLGFSVVLLLIVQQQGVQLDSLDAAFRRGQLQQLPAEIQDVKSKIGLLRSEFVSVQELDTLRQSQNDWANTLDTKLNQYIKSVEGQSAIPERLAHLEQRINDLQGTADVHDKRISSLATDWQNKFEKLAPQKQKATPAKKSQRVIKPVTAPFALTSIEHRGGQQYAVIIPHSASNRWSDIRMLTPGESVNGWTLASIDGNQARFWVNGKPQILTLQ